VTEKVTLEILLLWASDHTYKNWSLVRLHCIDATSPEPLETLQAVRQALMSFCITTTLGIDLFREVLQAFRDKYEDNRDTVDDVLLTVTMWDMVSDSNDLPPPGTVVKISNYSSIKLFRGEQCQLTANLKGLSW
jgi:hypothetical protein